MNKIIRNSIVFDDYAIIRRELVEKYYLRRIDDCKKYWKDTLNVICLTFKIMYNLLLEQIYASWYNH